MGKVVAYSAFATLWVAAGAACYSVETGSGGGTDAGGGADAVMLDAGWLDAGRDTGQMAGDAAEPSDASESSDSSDLSDSAADGGLTDDGGAVAEDGGRVDDAGAQDTGVADSGSGDGCVPSGACKTECLGVECGPIPDGCCGVLYCGDCGDGTDTCIKYDPPRFQGKVHNAVESVKNDHPEYFDFSQPQGESVMIVQADAYHAAVAAWLNASGVVAITDPNDQREVRVRPPAEDRAENFLIHTSWGYTAYKYTSTCTPAGF